MMWFYKNEAARLSVLTAIDHATGEYTVDIDRPNAVAESYRFPDETTCSLFLEVLERRLQQDGWTADGVTVTDDATAKRKTN